MNAVKELILDLALEEVVGDRTPPDLEERILAATVAAPKKRRFSIRPALAAAAVLLIAMGVWWAVSGDPSVPPTPPPPPVLTAIELTQVEEWIALLRISQTELDMSKPEGGRAAIATMNAANSLRHLMDGKPEAFPLIRERLNPIPGAERPRDVLDHFVEVLARGPDPASDPAVLALIEAASGKLSSDVLIALAENRVRQARDLLAGRIESGGTNPGLAGLALPAAYFAFRGDHRGEEILGAAVARVPMPGMMTGNYVAAAAALHRLGDPSAWQNAVAAARTRVAEMDQAGRVGMASGFVADLVYFNQTVATGQPVSLTNLFIRLKEHWVQSKGMSRTAAELLSDLDTLAK